MREGPARLEYGPAKRGGGGGIVLENPGDWKSESPLLKLENNVLCCCVIGLNILRDMF